MLEELTALAQISEIDSTALRSETELKELPERIASLDEDIRRLSELLDSERQELAEAEKLLAAQQQEIENQQQALSRSKSKSAKARNTREADAVERELEVIRRLMKDREAERDALREAIAARQEKLSKHEADLAKVVEVATKEREAAERRMTELRASYEEALRGRDELAAKVPANILRRYDLIRQRRGGMGVAIIKAGNCTGCNVALSPQIGIKVQRGESLEQCPNCQRFLCPLSLRPGAAGSEESDS